MIMKRAAVVYWLAGVLVGVIGLLFLAFFLFKEIEAARIEQQRLAAVAAVAGVRENEILRLRRELAETAPEREKLLNSFVSNREELGRLLEELSALARRLDIDNQSRGIEGSQNGWFIYLHSGGALENLQRWTTILENLPYQSRLEKIEWRKLAEIWEANITLFVRRLKEK